MDNILDFEVNSKRWLSLEDFEGEIWKDIPGYEGFYQCSNMGRIKSVDRIIKFKRPQDRFERNQFLKGTIIKMSMYGQYYICHLKRNSKSKAIKVHRVICAIFHPNPDNLPEVNHINEVKTDNRAVNLEWCTRVYNANWGTAIQRAKIKRANNPLIYSPVCQYDLDGNFISEYKSITEAERETGILSSNISGVCLLKRSTSAGGYIWTYSGDNETLQKILQRRNKPIPSVQKSVCQYSFEGRYIKTFSSIKEASCEVGISCDLIVNCCNHKGYQRTAAGFKWEYEDVPNRDELAKKQCRRIERRTIICYDVDWNFVAEYPSQRAAASGLGLDSSNVSRCCRGILATCKGYRFAFKD